MTAIPGSAAHLSAAGAELVSLLVAGADLDALVNGVDDFEHSAVAAIMIYDPTFPVRPGWRGTCSGVLVHKRVIQTAGHCIQFTRALLQAGIVKAVWISFQQDPLAHFNADPAFQDPECLVPGPSRRQNPLEGGVVAHGLHERVGHEEWV